MSKHLTDKQRAARDAYILAHHRDMNMNELARHFDVATSTIRSVADRLGVKTRPIPRQTKGVLRLPAEGKLSGTRPTYLEMQEYHNAQPKLDPALMVFLV